MRFRIRGGTADNSAASLRLTCRFATIVNGRSLSDYFCALLVLVPGRSVSLCDVF